MIQDNNKIYPNDVIEGVIFKITFSNLIKPEENMDKFYEKIKRQFPYKKTKEKPEISIKITNQEGKINTTPKPFAWYFHELEDMDASPFIIEITKDYVLLEFRAYLKKYSGFDDLMEYINLVINAISVYNIEDVKVLGLRYINKIHCKKGNPLKWGEIINDNLLCTDLLLSVDDPSRVLSNLIFKKNDFSIHFNYGIANIEFPNPISRKEFILDFDCLSFDNNFYEINQVTKDMHDTIKELFNEFKGPKLEKYMLEE